MFIAPFFTAEVVALWPASVHDLDRVRMLQFARVGDVRVVKINPAHRDLVMSQQTDALAAKALDHKTAARKPIAVQHDASAKKFRQTPGRREKRPVIMGPKMAGTE